MTDSPLLHGRNQHNIINQLSSNKKKDCYRKLFLKGSSFLKKVYPVKGLPRWLSGKEPTCQCKRHRRPRFNPWIENIPRRRNWQPVQSSCLGIPMDRGILRATVHGVVKKLDMT